MDISGCCAGYSSTVLEKYPPTDLSVLEVPGLTCTKTHFRNHGQHNSDGPKLVVVMVGLPARGKSYISKKLARYLNWLQYETRVFNAGHTRRNGMRPEDLNHSAHFFDPENTHAVLQRDEIAMRTLSDLLGWLWHKKSRVGILDATNSTIERRQMVLDRVRRYAPSSTEVLFLESCCYDVSLLEKNILLKLCGPDYRHRVRDASLADFRKRMNMYEKSYVSMGTIEIERQLPYLQLIDVGRQVTANCINGYLSTLAVEYLLNFRLHERQIWITRNGESIDDSQGIIGRNSPLSTNGTKFAHDLVRFIGERRALWKARYAMQERSTLCAAQVPEKLPHNSHKPPTQLAFHVWTSMMEQAISTGQPFDEQEYKISHLPMLNDLNAGKMEGLTFDEIDVQYKDEVMMRRDNPVYYRWPGIGGESYADVIHRLRPMINELERVNDHLLLITHRAVARVLLAYFQELDWNDIINIEIPIGRVFSVELRPYGVAVESYQYDVTTNSFTQLH